MFQRPLLFRHVLLEYIDERMRYGVCMPTRTPSLRVHVPILTHLRDHPHVDARGWRGCTVILSPTFLLRGLFESATCLWQVETGPCTERRWRMVQHARVRLPELGYLVVRLWMRIN